jgi:hypothetical protein
MIGDDGGDGPDRSGDRQEGVVERIGDREPTA